MNQPRYTSLSDYRNLLRRQRWVVIAVAATFALAGLAVSLAQTPNYAAQASISYGDVTEDLRVIGVNVLPEQAPLERAAAEARQITTPRVAERAAIVLEEEGLELTPAELLGMVNTEVAADTAFVIVEARSEIPEEAAAVANEVAEQSVMVSRRETRLRLAGVLEGFEAQLEESDPEDPALALVRQQVAQLRAIRESVEPAEVVQVASVPAEPVSPRPVRNTALGLLVGLTFGLLAAFLRDSLDRKIRTPAQAYEALGFPVLSRVAESAMGHTGLAGDAQGKPSVGIAELEAFRVLRTNLGIFGAEAPVKTIIVTSGLPEEGKSTVAASLASIAASSGQRTMLVDADLRRPTVATRLGLEASPGLSDYLVGNAGAAEIVRVRRLHHPDPEAPLDPSASPEGLAGAQPEGPVAMRDSAPDEASFAVIPAGSPHSQPAELLASDRCREFVRQVGEAYDLVVIDTSPLLASVDPLELIPGADAVVLCVRSGRSTLEEVEAVQAALALLPERPTGIVLTGVKSGGEGYDGYGFYYGYDGGD